VLLLAACREQKPPAQAINEVKKSPLQNTVISSFDHYRPEPLILTGSINAKRLEAIGGQRVPFGLRYDSRADLIGISANHIWSLSGRSLARHSGNARVTASKK